MLMLILLCGYPIPRCIQSYTVKYLHHYLLGFHKAQGYGFLFSFFGRGGVWSGVSSVCRKDIVSLDTVLEARICLAFRNKFS